MSNLVLAEIKTLGKGNIMLRITFSRRSHGKTAWFHPDHIQFNRGVKINRVEYITNRRGSSNKYHVFAFTNRGVFNGYGRIGKTMTIFGPMSETQGQKKMDTKMRRGGYKEQVWTMQYFSDEQLDDMFRLLDFDQLEQLGYKMDIYTPDELEDFMIIWF